MSRRRRGLYKAFVSAMPMGPLLAKLNDVTRADLYWTGYQAGYKAAMERITPPEAEPASPIFFDPTQPK